MYSNVGANPEPDLAATIPLSIFSMFQMMFAMIAPILISGALAERINFSSWIIYICLWHLVVYCPLAHMVWHPDGILRKWGFIDFAGGLVIEMSSGYSALAAAMFLNQKNQKINVLPTQNNDINQQTNIIIKLYGTGLLWFGWLGFNVGSAGAANALACQAFATTNVSGAASMMTWVFLDYLIGRQSSAVGACNGVVIGLVAVTPACGYITVGGAMVTGCMSCVVCYIVGIVFKERSNIDDSLDVFAVHGVAGTCGVFFTAFFCSKDVNPAGYDGVVYGHGTTLGKHIAVILVSIPSIMISSYVLCMITNAFIPLRVTEEEEDMGLDISMHNESMHEVNKAAQVYTKPVPAFVDEEVANHSLEKNNKDQVPVTVTNTNGDKAEASNDDDGSFNL